MLVFSRWVKEFGLQALLEDCERLAIKVAQRIRDDQLVVYIWRRWKELSGHREALKKHGYPVGFILFKH